MPNNIGKSMKIYMAKLKKLPPRRYAASLLSNCRYPKTPSFSLDRHVVPQNADDSATLTDVDLYLVENFRSLYLEEDSRFFFSPRPKSSYLVQTSPSSSEADSVADEKVDGLVVTVTSSDPYDDFRKSMKEMIEDRDFGEGGEELDWDFMEKLLLCYLELNDKDVHKYILKAFTDMAARFQRRMKGDPRRKKVCTEDLEHAMVET